MRKQAQGDVTGLPKIPQLINGRSGIEPRSIWLQYVICYWYNYIISPVGLTRIIRLEPDLGQMCIISEEL